ncbi:hypothetical protein CO046_01580 [Candidatus Peregrinibacteria bacterium CG_4_9_14_0_2_um_filter_53_11]|nr:MAG: hypothetical protein CO046_01580 [Candidatus Peregrinibacteria bacterium CG_4_9_14_0_2_um_filter_53_11]
MNTKLHQFELTQHLVWLDGPGTPAAAERPAGPPEGEPRDAAVPEAAPAAAARPEAVADSAKEAAADATEAAAADAGAKTTEAMAAQKAAEAAKAAAEAAAGDAGVSAAEKHGDGDAAAVKAATEELDSKLAEAGAATPDAPKPPEAPAQSDEAGLDGGLAGLMKIIEGLISKIEKLVGHLTSKWLGKKKPKEKEGKHDTFKTNLLDEDAAAQKEPYKAGEGVRIHTKPGTQLHAMNEGKLSKVDPATGTVEITLSNKAKMIHRGLNLTGTTLSEDATIKAGETLGAVKVEGSFTLLLLDPQGGELTDTADYIPDTITAYGAPAPEAAPTPTAPPTAAPTPAPAPPAAAPSTGPAAAPKPEPPAPTTAPAVTPPAAAAPAPTSPPPEPDTTPLPAPSK